jgi:hypothetical protein
MRSCFIGLAVLALLVNGTAFANSPTVKEGWIDAPAGADGPGCLTEGYKSYTLTSGAPIPDNTARGVVSGPLAIADAEGVIDAVVDVSISHTWVGDLSVELFYDDECNGFADDSAISLLCRQDLAGCTLVGGCCGCSSDLVTTNTYTFSSAGSGPIAEPCGASPVPAGCFTEAVETVSRLGDVTAKEGCWYLVISDGAGADTGFLSDWTLYFLNDTGTATEAASWGSVKSLYNE